MPKAPMPATLSTASTRPKVSSGGREHRLDVALDADVAAAGDDRLAQLGGGLVLLPGDVGSEDLGALTHEHLRRGSAHPRAGAR